MAKIKPVILKWHPVNTDGTFNVKIKIAHKTKSAYLDTGCTIAKKNLVKGQIRPMWIAENLADLLNEINAGLKEISHNFDQMTAKDIKEYLLSKPKKTQIEKVDFLKYFKNHYQTIKNKGAYFRAFKTAYNALNGFVGNGELFATEITANFLSRFEKYLIDRGNTGKMVGIKNIMREIKTVFNKVKNEFNDEDTGVILIPNNPYKKYKLPVTALPAKRSLTAQMIRTVYSCKVVAGSSAELAKEMALLSFFLCGTNAIDLYKAHPVEANRFEFNRSKTKNKRKDNAFISIAIVEEARPLFDKYVGQLNKRYSSNTILNMGICIGMKKLRALTGIPNLDFYSFRHSFATIARNDCRFSKDDIALAMNHVDQSYTVTDIYLKKDWSIIDQVQRGVIDFVFEKKPACLSQ